ncbi:acyl-CoA synthetase/AMP-acid ligase-like protein II [Microthyrium microscopicum]|uniref:Acyl-CoA synthetase/AMP-acid ligase-like protein II n=1 Tax=Microthyrium microscopicum TaxID=703497 RepID=A0A6A6UNF9_9PEZI|nr:acyl-CoA synthetase/AMP-acid ligase-like protein II [Microthyrium microscopicum]
MRWLLIRAAASRIAGVRQVMRPQCRGFLTRAFAKGPTEPPLLEMTIGEHFGRVVKEYGDRLAVISHHQSIKLTYDQLDADSTRLAKGLQRLGVRKGDRCAVSLGNNVEFATLTYAIFKLGAVLVPLNPAFNSPQVIAALNHLSATHYIVSAETNLPRKQPRSNVSLLTELVPNISSSRSNSTLQSQAVPSLQDIIIIDNAQGRIDTRTQLAKAISYQDVLHSGDSSRSAVTTDAPLDANDIVNIQFTSGTTSMPKAACLSHRNILNNGNSIGDRMRLTPNDIVCCPPPLFHCFGCILGYMATATHASAIAFPSEAFSPSATLATVREHSCTALYGVPTMFLAELDLLSSGVESREGLSQLRTGIAAGSSIPAELMKRLHRELHLTELTICYGMTETSPVSAMTTTDDPLIKRVETVGRALPHVDVKIVDPGDWNRVLGVGERGELAVSGYLVMKGYWEDEKRTKEVFGTDEDGVVWMHASDLPHSTGDEASIDEDGYVTITGRIKDLIIKGGENIHPLEVENCLFAHPQVAEVSVVGLPDERYGEAVAAFVVPRKSPEGSILVSAEEIRSWVRDRLSHHLVPKYVFWVNGYPKTASGKIQKFKLRETGQTLVKEGKGME